MNETLSVVASTVAFLLIVSVMNQKKDGTDGEMIGIPVLKSRNRICSCYMMPEHPTSQDYNKRYLAMKECKIHSKVPDRETKRYERVKGIVPVRPKGKHKAKIFQAFAVMQAVELGKTGQIGMKAFDTPSGYRVMSTFPTREDARAYLLNVLDTVKRERGMGVRSKRNLDPKYEGGLDFLILPVDIVVPRAPLISRGWKLEYKQPKKIDATKIK